jgi:hypothetical protein
LFEFGISKRKVPQLQLHNFLGCVKRGESELLPLEWLILDIEIFLPPVLDGF